jgi:hypothetical protein
MNNDDQEDIYPAIFYLDELEIVVSQLSLALLLA